MKKFLFLLLIFPALWAQDAAKKPEAGEHHEFVIDNFRTESGVDAAEGDASSTARTDSSTPRATTSCCCRRTTWRLITATSG